MRLPKTSSITTVATMDVARLRITRLHGCGFHHLIDGDGRPPAFGQAVDVFMIDDDIAGDDSIDQPGVQVRESEPVLGIVLA